MVGDGVGAVLAPRTIYCDGVKTTIRKRQKRGMIQTCLLVVLALNKSSDVTVQLRKKKKKNTNKQNERLFKIG